LLSRSGAPSDEAGLNDQLRGIPSVDETLLRLEHLLARYPRRLVVDEIRRVQGSLRDDLRAGRDGDPAVEQQVERNLESLERPSLRHVINATGVVLHTNLGRAPLPDNPPLEGYSNLEYNLETGRRGNRDVHAAGLIERLTGAPGIAVNNNAAAVYLALNELATGFEAIVSRGELIEIGDGFRIPDIMARSGAILREVGTTNRTRIDDYRAAITDRTRLLMRVHPSNFRIQGFTSQPARSELAALGRERGIPVYEDLGSGCVVDLRSFGVDEPLVGDSLRAGVNLVSFSGDKLLGGPQAGIVTGDPVLVARLRRNPMFRALRLDKLVYQSLETTLRHLLFERFDRIPALRMIALTPERLRERATSLAEKVGGTVLEGESVIGGGSTPAQSIPTWLTVVARANVITSESKLRLAEPPVIARIQNDRLVFDLRTVFESEEPALVRAILNS
jgi:L-seryl-tRNA(Ser) seleniumtransferase